MYVSSMRESILELTWYPLSCVLRDIFMGGKYLSTVGRSISLSLRVGNKLKYDICIGKKDKFGIIHMEGS